VSSNPDLLTTRPRRSSYEILKQLVIFQMTYLGAPMIYYGTEVGMWGANDPDNRQPMFWEDVRQEPESHTPRGSCKATARKPDMKMFAFYRKAIALRRKHEVLRRGKLKWVATEDDRLLAFLRYDGRTRVLVLLNASDLPLKHRLRESYTDLWSRNGVVARGDVEIKARGWRVLLQRSDRAAH